MVVLGAGAKGRSSSKPLNKMLVQEMAICVARDVYVCGVHSPTWALRADDPSRGKPLTPPRAPLPAWILLLRSGQKAQAQDVLDQSSGTWRALGRWYLLCAVACLAVWLLLLTYPVSVSGPRPSAQPRDRADLERGRVTTQTWLSQEEPALTNLPHASRQNLVLLAERLEEYGRVMYEQGSSRRIFAETINSIQQRFPFLKTLLVGPWQLCTTWENICPGTLHPPIPFPLLKAMGSVAYRGDGPGCHSCF